MSPGNFAVCELALCIASYECWALLHERKMNWLEYCTAQAAIAVAAVGAAVCYVGQIIPEVL